MAFRLLRQLIGSLFVEKLFDLTARCFHTVFRLIRSGQFSLRGRGMLSLAKNDEQSEAVH